MNQKIKILISAFVVISSVLVNTTPAKALTVPDCNSAVFNGSVTTNGSATTVWFEWGTTSALGQSTQHQTYTHDGDFSQLVSGLAQNTTYYYRAMAQNAGGTATGDVISFSTPLCTSNITPTVNISSDDSSVNSGSGTTIRWTSSNATSCQGTGGANNWASGLKAASGSFFTGALTSNKTFTITCQNDHGGSASDSVSINIGSSSNTQPNVDISTDDTSIDFEDSTRIHWSSDNADECTASGGSNGWSGDRNTSGNFSTGDLTSDKTYKITCRNNDSGKSDSASVTVHVGDNDQNKPEVDISADRTSLNLNESTVIRWDTTDADECTTSGGNDGWPGHRSASGGSFNTGPLSFTATYYISCSNDSGSTNDSVTVNVNGVQQNIAGPTTTTLSATQITSGSAQLNSLIINNGNAPANAWFEWGATANLGGSTISTPVGSGVSTPHSDIISGLSPGVRYYYRAVAQNNYGISYGSTLSFLTNSLPTPATTVVRNTTVINNGGTNSLIMLSIDGGEDAITSGENRIYHVQWKNISRENLRKVTLRVILPRSMSFDATNRGFFSAADNSVNLEIGTLAPSDSGDMIFTARANTIASGELVVVVANMVYTEPSSAQGDAVAYATHHGVVAGSVLGASAFGSGFYPNSILGWLFLLILILIILLLVKHLMNQSRKPEVVVQH